MGKKKCMDIDAKLCKPKGPEFAGSSLRSILHTYGALMTDYTKKIEEENSGADGAVLEVDPGYRMGSHSMARYMLQYIQAAFAETFGDEDLVVFLMIDLAAIIKEKLDERGCSLQGDSVSDPV